MQKLALLVGDVIAQKSKGNLAYRLAEIYFSDLKDYQLAAQQYAYALTVDLEDALRPMAWFKQAQSFELLALKEGEKSIKGKEYLSQAIALYDSLTAHYPAGELTDQAVVTAFTLRLQLTEKAEDLRTLGTEFLNEIFRYTRERCSASLAWRFLSLLQRIMKVPSSPINFF